MSDDLLPAAPEQRASGTSSSEAGLIAGAQLTTEGFGDLNLRQLECFFAVAETLHFGNAAEKLFMSQPSVSEAVSRLERSLGQPLLRRTTRRVQLTPFGVEFLRHVRPAYDSLLTAYRVAKRDPADHALIRLAHTPELGQALLPHLVPRLEAEGYGPVGPRRWSPAMMHTQSQLLAVLEKRIDVGLCWQPNPIAGLHQRVLTRCPFVALYRESDPLAGHGPLELADLANRDLLVSSRSYSRPLHAILQRSMEPAGLMPAAINEVDEYEEIASRVVASGSVGLHPATLALVNRIPGVTFSRVIDAKLEVDICAIARSNSCDPLSGFMDVIEMAATTAVSQAIDCAG